MAVEARCMVNGALPLASGQEREEQGTMKNSRSILLILLVVFAMASRALAERAPETRIVTDVWKREVEIPSEVHSIVCLGSMGPRFAAYLDVVDMMVGAEDSDINRMTARYDYSPVYHEQLKKLPSVGSGGGSGENNGYAEAIIQAQPDVILAGFNEDACEELQAQTGIPVVSVRYRAQGFIDEGFHRAMRVFAEVVGAQERCEEVLSYVEACRQDLNGRTEGIPD